MKKISEEQTFIHWSYKKQLNEQKMFSIFGSVHVFLKDKLPDSINLPLVLKKIELLIPRHFVDNLDSIYIGYFKEFEEKNINAFLKDDTIYITNMQDDEEDFIDDIIHEIAHVTEQNYASEIYADDQIEIEFLGKRRRLQHLLQYEGYPVEHYDFLDIDYSEEFDFLLYEDVGYAFLTNLTMGLFASPYAATSLNEYFADGFEEYFLRDRQYLLKVSPNIHRKIENLLIINDF